MTLTAKPNTNKEEITTLIKAKNNFKNRLAHLGSWVADFQQWADANICELDGKELNELSGFAVNEMLPVMGVKGATQKATVKFRAGAICGIHARHLRDGIWILSIFRPSKRSSQIKDQKSGEAIMAKKDSMRTYKVNAHGDDLLRFLKEGDLDRGIELTQ